MAQNPDRYNYDVWFSCPKFTVLVIIDDDRTIVGGAPYIRKFIGQPLGNLSRWAVKFGKAEQKIIGQYKV